MDPRQDRVDHESESARLQREIDQTRARMDDTACAIQDRLTVRALTGDLVDLLASGAGIGSRRALKGIKNNPIPAALVGLGIAWLLADRAAGRRRRDEEYYEEEHEPGRVGQAIHQGARAASDAAHRAGQRISSAASSAKETVLETAHAAGDTIRDTASAVGHRVRDTAAAISDKARSTAHYAGEQISHVTGRARDMAQSARSSVVDTYEENPLILGAAAFAVGLVGGLAIPTSSIEDRLMGRASKNLKDRAKAVGEQAVQAGRQVAGRAVDAAKEAAAEGRSPADRIANAAEAALNTAAAEAAEQTRTIAQGGRTPGDQRRAGQDAGSDTGA